jgi:purine catabolism regulator
VASAASTDPSTRDLYRLSDTHIRGFLELLKDDSRLPALVDRELGPILRGDDRSKPALLEVLDVFISANLNKLTAARKLGISRPTLDARLREIERRLAVRLADAETVTSLHFALMAHRLLESESSRAK